MLGNLISSGILQDDSVWFFDFCRLHCNFGLVYVRCVQVRPIIFLNQLSGFKLYCLQVLSEKRPSGIRHILEHDADYLQPNVVLGGTGFLSFTTGGCGGQVVFDVVHSVLHRNLPVQAISEDVESRPNFHVVFGDDVLELVVYWRLGWLYYLLVRVLLFFG